MMRCWEFEPDGRPSFASLVDTLSWYLEAMASYMDLGSSISKSLEGNESVVMINTGIELQSENFLEKESFKSPEEDTSNV